MVCERKHAEEMLMTTVATAAVGVPAGELHPSLADIKGRHDRLIDKCHQTVKDLHAASEGTGTLEDSIRRIEKQQTKMAQLQEEIQQLQLHDDVVYSEAKEKRYIGWCLAGFAAVIALYDIGIEAAIFAEDKGAEKTFSSLILSSGYLVVAVLSAVAGFFEFSYQYYEDRHNALNKLTNDDVEDILALLKLLRRRQKLLAAASNPEEEAAVPTLQRQYFEQLNNTKPKLFEKSVEREEWASSTIEALPENNPLRQSLQRAVEVSRSQAVPPDLVELSAPPNEKDEADQAQYQQHGGDVIVDLAGVNEEEESPRPEPWRNVAKVLFDRVQQKIGGVPLQYFKFGNQYFDPYGNIIEKSPG